jgi:hypothetical protein
MVSSPPNLELQYSGGRGNCIGRGREQRDSQQPAQRIRKACRHNEIVSGGGIAAKRPFDGNIWNGSGDYNSTIYLAHIHENKEDVFRQPSFPPCL